jgi:hypothetical protein
MDKILFTGRIISVKARIRLIRSFDQVPTHQYQGYTLILDGEVDGMPRNRMKVAIGPKAHEQHQFRIGDSIMGKAVPVPDPETEWAGSIRSVGSNSSNVNTLAIGHLAQRRHRAAA